MCDQFLHKTATIICAINHHLVASYDIHGERKWCYWCCCRILDSSTDNGGGVQYPSLRTPADGIPHLAGIRSRWVTGVPLHSTSRFPSSTGAVHKSVTFSGVFMLVQLNKCVVVCGSGLQRGHGIVVMGVCLRRFC